MKYCFIFICCFISLQVVAQKKYEKESRISKEDFPENALKLLHGYTETAKRLRFYRETDSTKTSFEAKFKIQNKKYSIEFDADGILEDIEIEIAFRKLPEAIKQNISQYLEHHSKKYSIKKVQKQYYLPGDVSAKNTMVAAFKDLDINFIRYELVVWRSSDEESGMVEFTFNHLGEYLLERPFSQASYDHILY
ncbi:hypothetical protein ACJD0Z_16635 [Flavobacteriaceae bacterium M23B6Z8]